jgi:hypothetical protein
MVLPLTPEGEVAVGSKCQMFNVAEKMGDTYLLSNVVMHNTSGSSLHGG